MPKGKKPQPPASPSPTPIPVPDPTPTIPPYTTFGTWGDPGAYKTSPGNNSQTAIRTESPQTTVDVEKCGSINWAWSAQNQRFADLAVLSSDVFFKVGQDWGGSPRFELTLIDPATLQAHKMFLYVGDPPNFNKTCPMGSWFNTGNLMDPTKMADDQQFPNGTYGDTVANALTKYGTWRVNNILLGTDGGWVGPQTVDFDNTYINSWLYTYE